MISNELFKSISVEEVTNTKLPAGKYRCIIKNVEDVAEKSYLSISLDIVEGDYKGYFQQQFDKNTDPNKKWDFKARISVFYTEKALPFFKRFIINLEKINKFEFNCERLEKIKGKFLPVYFAEEDYMHNGLNYTRVVASQWLTVEEFQDKNFTPTIKRKKKEEEKPQITPIVPVEEYIGDDVPF